MFYKINVKQKFPSGSLHATSHRNLDKNEPIYVIKYKLHHGIYCCCVYAWNKLMIFQHNRQCYNTLLSIASYLLTWEIAIFGMACTGLWCVQVR